MSDSYIFICIFVIAAVTYLIRFVPLVVFKKPIKNRFFRSFLYYTPYIALSVMTFPSILYCTGNTVTALIGLFVALIMSVMRVNFVITTFGTCLIVFAAQLFVV